MKVFKTGLCVVATVCLFVQGLNAGPESVSLAQGMDTSKVVVVYEVNKRVSDFPEKEDFSTPESAYAAINRVMASGGSDADWSRVSGRELRNASSRVTPQDAEMWNEAIIREVNVYLGRVAAVFAEVRTASGEVKFDQRSVFFINGQWFNRGQDGLADSLEDARANFARKKDRLHPSWEDAISEETLKYAKEHPNEIRDAAKRLFEAIRTADYASGRIDLSEADVGYEALTWRDAWSVWICKTFKDNPIMSVKLGETTESKVRGSRGRINLPAVPYELVLKNGEILEGDLPFRYDQQNKSWFGTQGLDWHLKYMRGLSAAPVSVLLEQGIYTEETVGDLPRAIEIYSEIVADNQANRKYVAEALFRLGLCHVASGQNKIAL